MSESTENPQENEQSQTESADRPIFRVVGASPTGVIGRLFQLPADMTVGAFRTAVRAGEYIFAGERSFIPGVGAQLDLMKETGAFIRDSREVAGLTLDELSEAMNLDDKSLLEGVENGTAALSFELLLRMAALIARHDPVPFVMRTTRAYNPGIWRILNNWGVGRVSLQYERERQFVSILRRHDAARKLSDEGFAKVLDYTRSAFDMAIHFVAELEGVEDRELTDEELKAQNVSAETGDRPKQK